MELKMGQGESSNKQFHKTLLNLVFSANNPFQSNFNYIVGQHYVK